MKVRDLIEALKAVDADLPVLVDAYESGYEAPKSVDVVQVVPSDKEADDWWAGEFDPSHPSNRETPMPALLIARSRKPWG